MNVELIKIDPQAARRKLDAYRKAIQRRHHSEAGRKATAEYEQIAAGYEAAAKGLPLIELTRAMATGGWDELGRPKFAVARADRRRVACVVERSGRIRFSDPDARQHVASMNRTIRGEDMPTRPAVPDLWQLRAIVPMVPPDVLPRANCDLSKRAILWEADWQRAPEDPMLLLPLGGDLYAVEAAWDLTPLERAVIAGRLGTGVERRGPTHSCFDVPGMVDDHGVAWGTPNHSHEQVDSAGDTLISDVTTPEALEEAFEIVNNWRSCHGFPLNAFQIALRRKAKKVGRSALVAQRIKRLPAIIDKLKRFRQLKLSEVQDIGGCRAVVYGIKRVHALRTEFATRDTQHELIHETDYLASPKKSGYRGIHLIYKYNSDRARRRIMA